MGTKKSLFITMAVVFTVILVGVIILTNQANAMTAGTFMRVVGFQDQYVILVDQDGEKWQVTHESYHGELKEGMELLVQIDLKYLMDGKFQIIYLTIIEEKE